MAPNSPWPSLYLLIFTKVFLNRMVKTYFFNDLFNFSTNSQILYFLSKQMWMI